MTQEWRDIIAFLFVGALQGGCIGFLVGRESVRREQRPAPSSPARDEKGE